MYSIFCVTITSGVSLFKTFQFVNWKKNTTNSIMTKLKTIPVFRSWKGALFKVSLRVHTRVWRMPSRSSAFVTLSSMHDDARSGERRFAFYLVTLINIGKSTILKVVHFVYFQIHTRLIGTKWNLTMVWQRIHGWPCTGTCTKIVSGSPLALIFKIWTSSEVWNVLIWKLLSRSELVLAYHV